MLKVSELQANLFVAEESFFNFFKDGDLVTLTSFHNKKLCGVRLKQTKKKTTSILWYIRVEGKSTVYLQNLETGKYLKAESNEKVATSPVKQDNCLWTLKEHSKAKWLFVSKYETNLRASDWGSINLTKTCANWEGWTVQLQDSKSK